MTANRHKQIINAITGKARQIVPPGAEVILFGSRARGDARDDSDWDVLILLDKESITSQDIDDYTYPLRELGWIYNQCINAIPKGFYEKERSFTRNLRYDSYS